MQDHHKVRISVCLPTFNAEPYLAACLESVLAQAYDNFEILVSDDNSNDGTWQILQKYARLDNRIRSAKNDRHVGLLNNFNHCFSLSKAEFIKPLTQSTHLEPQALAKLVAVLDAHSQVSLAGGLYRTDHLPKSNQFWLPPQTVSSLNKPIKGISAIRKSLFPPINFIGDVSQVLFRRKWLGRSFDADFSRLAELDLWLRILLMGDLFQLNEAFCACQNKNDSYSYFHPNANSFRSEILRLGEKFADLMPKFGTSKEKYLEIACQAIPDIAIESGIEPASDISEINDASYAMAFREVANIAFNNRLETEPENFFYKRKIEKVMRPVKSYEKRVRKILNSFSWRLTSPLRAINKILGRNRKFICMEEYLHLTNNFEDQNLLYLHYLRAQIMTLIKSRSWDVTSWLRRLGYSLGLFCSQQSTNKIAVKKIDWQSRPALAELPLPAARLSQPGGYELAIAAIFRNEAAFLAEWIEFHRLIGCQKFFLFNNLSTDNFDSVLAPYIAGNIVELIDWPLESPDGKTWKDVQSAAYETALSLAVERKVHWLACIDIDEYLFASSETNLLNVLKQYEEYGGVAVNWQLFGPVPAGLIASGQLLIEAGTKAAEENFADNRYIKSIVHPQLVERCVNAHFFTYKHPYYAVTTDLNQVDDATAKTINVDKLRINHYRYKTMPVLGSEKRERFVRRNELFLATPSYLKQLDVRVDNTIQCFVPALKEKMAKRILPVLAGDGAATLSSGK